jgi:transcriptional regulator with XRE-family HTH domain
MTTEWWNGARLKAARARRKLTQTALAAKAGVRQETIARLESGTRRPSLRMLQKLAKALGTSIERLIKK